VADKKLSFFADVAGDFCLQRQQKRVNQKINFTGVMSRKKNYRE
jgi:hypothetical protein